jgi:hypothetical protein
MLDLITSGLISEAIENAGINESDTLKIIQIPKLPSMMDSIIFSYKLAPEPYMENTSWYKKQISQQGWRNRPKYKR